jgi:predicted enzyme related to lactoylglutathione lyase
MLMTCRLHALCFDANDPGRLASFWGGLLGWDIADDSEGAGAIVPGDDTGFLIRFLPTGSPKAGLNQMHLHLTSTSLEDQQRTVTRALELGAGHLDVGQTPEEGHVVLVDPEGNEFCVIEPGNKFLADCGFVGEVACEGSREAGYFWSEALGWPLVWDQDQETSIRSPHGGPKISWGGPPLTPKIGKYRLHFDLVPAAHDQAGDPARRQGTEVDRLVSLGATPIDLGQDDVSRVVMADPDGHEFCVLSEAGWTS